MQKKQHGIINVERPKTNKYRLQFIDITKGIGIILVICRHVYGPLMIWAKHFYIPVFFIISGYCTTRQINLHRKFNKLIIPYAIFTIILFAIYGSYKPFDFFGAAYSRWCLYPLGNENNLFFLKSGNGPLWFLTSMFTSFVLFVFLQKYKKKQITLLAIYMITTYILSYLPILLPWSLDTSFLMAIFIFCGTKIRDLSLLERVHYKWYIGMIILYIILWYYGGNINLSVRQYGRSLLVLFPAAIIGSFLLMKASKYIEPTFIGKMFTQIGIHSLSIFCLHIPFISLWAIIKYTFHSDFMSPMMNGIMCVVFIVVCTYLIALFLDKYIISIITNDGSK